MLRRFSRGSKENPKLIIYRKWNFYGGFGSMDKNEVDKAQSIRTIIKWFS